MSPETRDRLAAVRTAIDDAPHDAFDLTRLSHLAGVSRFHFIRAFRAAYGETPHQYLTRRRMEYARRLMSEGSSVTDACFAAGFRSLGSFSTAFARHVGVSPQGYRRSVRHRRARSATVPACYLVMFGVGASSP